MSDEDYNELPPEDQRHFMRCNTLRERDGITAPCGEWLDMRSLDDVFFHEDHIERPDIPSDGPGELMWDPEESPMQKIERWHGAALGEMMAAAESAAPGLQAILTVAFKAGVTAQFTNPMPKSPPGDFWSADKEE